MVTLEKNFIGEMCETCSMLSPKVYKSEDGEENTSINVRCEYDRICYNALMQAKQVKIKEG